MADDRPWVAHLVNSLAGGGMERGLVRLLADLPQEDVRHRVVTLRRAGVGAGDLPDHVPCWALDARGCARGAGLRLAAGFRGAAPRVLHARGLGTWADALLARLRMPRCRLVLGFHGLDHDGSFTAAQSRTARCGARLGARFCCVSLTGREKLVQETRVPADRVDVLFNGVQASRFTGRSAESRRKLRESLGFAPQDFVIACVASLTPVKDHITLLDAFRAVLHRHDCARLLLVGDGTLRGRIEAESARGGLGGRVVLAGAREDVPALLDAADACACSSRSEGMSHAVLEAMAARKPIVATRVGDNPLLLGDPRAGVLVEPGDSAGMAAELGRLIDDEDLRSALARAAGRRAEAFSQSAMTHRYARYYSALIGGAPTGASSAFDDAPALPGAYSASFVSTAM